MLSDEQLNKCRDARRIPEAKRTDDERTLAGVADAHERYHATLGGGDDRRTATAEHELTCAVEGLHGRGLL